MGEFVKGKVVVVTGSGGGIGRDMARVMAAHGAHVIVNDLGKVAGTEQSAAEQVAREIRSAGGQAVASTDSMASPSRQPTSCRPRSTASDASMQS